MNPDKKIFMNEIFNSQPENETLTELCASELTAGATGKLMENFFGAHD